MENKNLQEISQIRRNGLDLIAELKREHAEYFSTPIASPVKNKDRGNVER